MKKVVLLVLVMCVVQMVYAQPPSANGLLGTTQTTISGQWTSFKTIMGYIGAFLFGGGLIFALYCYLYDQSRMKTATISLIAGALLLTIAGAMQYIA